MIRVLVWNEFRHEKSSDKVREIYPEGMHKAIAEFLGKEEDFEVRTATLDDPECGLTEEVLAQTDVLFWWGHIAHSEVPDEIAQRVQKAVLSGMGLIVLHSGHHSKIFRKVCGKADVPVQTFFNRADTLGGSTLGNISLTHVSVPTADIGLPQLAMHSCYETAGVQDALWLEEAMAAYYGSSLDNTGEDYMIR